jgi:hypothetical protein
MSLARDVDVATVAVADEDQVASEAPIFSIYSSCFKQSVPFLWFLVPKLPVLVQCLPTVRVRARASHFGVCPWS